MHPMPSHVQSWVHCMHSNHAYLIMRPYVFITCILIMSSSCIHMPPLHAFQSWSCFPSTLHVMFELQVFNSHRLIPWIVFSLYAFILTSYACHTCIPIISHVLRHASSIFMHVHIFLFPWYTFPFMHTSVMSIFIPHLSFEFHVHICFSSFTLYTFTYIKTFMFSLHKYMHFIYTGVWLEPYWGPKH